jgi:putative multiple sugar transport system permease protein
MSGLGRELLAERVLADSPASHLLRKVRTQPFQHPVEDHSPVELPRIRPGPALHTVPLAGPRLTVAIPATVTVVGSLVTLLGPALSWPAWVLNLSPFTHLALVPAVPRDHRLHPDRPSRPRDPHEEHDLSKEAGSEQMTAPTGRPTPAKAKFKDLKKIFGGGQSDVRQFGILFSLIAIVVLFQYLTNGLTLSSGNLINLVSQYSYILILAIGMVMVIIAGHIDLSVGSVAAFVGIVVAISMQSWHFPWPVAILFGVFVGVLIGAWHGFWVAYIGVPAFIVTLAGMLIFRGGNQLIGNADTVPVPAGFTTIGAGYLPEIGPNTGYNNLTLLLGLGIAVVVVVKEWRARRVQQSMGSAPAPLWVSIVKVVLLDTVVVFATMAFAGGRTGTSFPVSGIILGVLVLLYSFIMRNTIFGRHVYAVGGNKLAAELSGVKSRRVNFLVMMNMSILAALAGMIFVARSVASGPQDGLSWELDAIAAVFIGGAAVSGGIGTVTGSIIGGLVMAVLNNGLQLQGVGADKVQIIKGMVLLVAVGVDVWNKSQGRPSITGFLMRGRNTVVGAAEKATGEVPRSGPPDASSPLAPKPTQHGAAN